MLVPDFQAQGFVPEAVINGLAFIGWHPKTTTDEVFCLEELEQLFDLAGVNKGAAQYDFEKMRWYNQQWLQKLTPENLVIQFLTWAEKFDANHLELLETNKEKLAKILPIIAQKAKTFAEFYEALEYFLVAPIIDKSHLGNEKMKVDEALALSVLQAVATLLHNIDEADFNAEMIREKAIEGIAAMELKNGQFLNPFRYALSGRDKSSGPFEIAAIIGKEESLKRINAYL